MSVQVQPVNRDIKRRDYKTTTRLWGLCAECRWTWRWNGKTEFADDGVAMICASACRCNWTPATPTDHQSQPAGGGSEET